jgi:hypothetical protein
MEIYDYEVPNDEKDYFKNFPLDISEEIQNYITNKVMDWSRYIFTHREGKKQWGYCTHCRQEHPTEQTLKHGKIAECPHCNSSCHVRSSGRGRSTLSDETYTLWYEKSTSDSNVIIARGFYAIRDYTKNFRETHTEFKVTALYLFQPGGGSMMSREYYGNYKRFIERRNVYSEAKHSMKNKACYHNKQSLKEAVHGTFLQYCTWEQYDHSDYLDVINLACRYKSIEFITKIGFGCIVVSKLTGQATYGAINWNGQTPQKILRLSMSQIKEMRKAAPIGARALRSFQISQKDGSKLSWQDAATLSDLIEKHNLDDVQKLTQHLTIPEMKKYFAKQLQRDNEKKRRTYTSGMTIFRDWRDYIKECNELGIDITKESILLPRDLHAAHQETSQRIKHIRDEKVAAQIKEREKILKEFCFEHNELFIRPASTGEELIAEGKELKHCVGSYAKRHAEGETTIFFIRQKAKPEKPFFTLELKIEKISQGFLYKIVQCRGKENCGMTSQVKSFVDTFQEKKLKPKKRAKVRIKNNNRVEVAI